MNQGQVFKGEYFDGGGGEPSPSSVQGFLRAVHICIIPGSAHSWHYIGCQESDRMAACKTSWNMPLSCFCSLNHGEFCLSRALGPVWGADWTEITLANRIREKKQVLILKALKRWVIVYARETLLGIPEKKILSFWSYFRLQSLPLFSGGGWLWPLAALYSEWKMWLLAISSKGS